eukprot:365318-Chlamydomonas_euryale.AAC.16
MLTPSIGQPCLRAMVHTTLIFLVPFHTVRCPAATRAHSLNASFKKMLATKGVASSSEIMRFEEQASTAAADFIEQTPGMRELVEFAWLKEGGLYLFESEEEAYDELQELKAMTDRGWSTDLEVWGAAETNKRLGSVGYHGAIRYPKVGKVWAARWALGVALQAAKAAANGACGGVGLCGSRLAIFEGAKATAVDDVRPSAADYTAAGLNRPHGLKVRTQDKVRNIKCRSLHSRNHSSEQQYSRVAAKLFCQDDSWVHTSRGDVISARAVVHCTNAYSSALLPELRGLLIPVRNHVAATAPLHASQAMLDIAVYARRGQVARDADVCIPLRGPIDAWILVANACVCNVFRPDGRLVFGGFRDEVPGMEEGNDDDANLDQHIRSRLHEYLPAHFPSRFDGAACGPHFEMEWAGILGFTAD